MSEVTEFESEFESEFEFEFELESESESESEFVSESEFELQKFIDEHRDTVEAGEGIEILLDEAGLATQLLSEGVSAYVFAQEVTLEQLLSYQFEPAKKLIRLFTLSKRCAISAALNKRLLALYESLKNYGRTGIDRDSMITAKQYYSIMGKIKHAEILLTEVYGL